MSDNKIPNKTDADLRQLALDLVDGRVFTDRQAERELSMVFMPLALGALVEWTKEEIMEIGLIYEYLSEAGPRSVNGLPNFFSMKMVNRHDLEPLQKYVNELVDSRKKFMNGGADANSAENQQRN